MEITFSEHASRRMDLYKLDRSEIKRLVATSRPSFFDIRTNTLIFIGKITLKVGVREVVVVITDEEGSRKVVTVYPCSELEKEIARKLNLKRCLKIE